MEGGAKWVQERSGERLPVLECLGPKDKRNNHGDIVNGAVAQRQGEPPHGAEVLSRLTEVAKNTSTTMGDTREGCLTIT